MEKILVVIAREIRSRIFKRSFILMTFLGPLLMAFVSIIPIWLATGNEDRIKIFVLDETGFFLNEFTSENNTEYQYHSGSMDPEVISQISEGYSAVIKIPKDFYTTKTAYISYNESIGATQSYSVYKILKEGYIAKETAVVCPEADLKSLKSININLVQDKLGGNRSNDEWKTALGFILAVIIYFFILFYGMQVMRGVIEEKSSRVIELLITSVKPFQLMMGKILGVAIVSLIQFSIWLTVISTGFFLVHSKYGEALNLFSDNNINNTLEKTSNVKLAMEFNTYVETFSSLNLPLILIGFFYFFLLGYLLYGALFAAIGSAGDHETDVQQFVLPLTLPLFLCFTFFTSVIKEPSGSIAIFLSVFPFTSPIIMAVRLPFINDWSDLIAPMVSIAITFVFAVWVAGRIYRTGIMLHGNNPSFKKLWRWTMSKN